MGSATLRQSRRLSTALAFLSPLLLGSVCAKPCPSSAGGPCETGIPVGGKLYVTILERWDENSTLRDPRGPSALPSCEALAFRSGDRIVLRATDGVAGGRLGVGVNCEDCQSVLAHATALTAGGRRFEPTPVMRPEDWKVLGNAPLESWDHVVIDSDCQGTLVISFGITSGGDPRLVGRSLYRTFIPDEGSCLSYPMAEGTPGGGNPPPYHPFHNPLPGCWDRYIATGLDAPPPDWPAELGTAGSGVDGGAGNPSAGGGSSE